MATKRSASATQQRDNIASPAANKLPVIPRIPGFSPRAEDRFAVVLRRVPPTRLLVASATISALIYLAFTLAFPITAWWNHPHSADNANAINDLGRITSYSPVAAVAFVLAIVALFACQFFAYIATPGGDPIDAKAPGALLRQRLVLFMPLAFAAVLIWMQPVTTTDLYGYVARGYLFAQLHVNPMTHLATALPGNLSVDRPPSPYGPAWLLVTGLFSLVSGENLLVNMLLFKLVGFLSVAGAIWLVDSLARELYPARRLRILVLFGWSPLLLFEAVGNGHNDIVMMVCVLAAFALMQRGHSRSAFALILVGALVKYVSAVFLPFWFIFALRQHALATTANDPAYGTFPRRRSPSRALNSARRLMDTAAMTVREIDLRAASWLIAQCSVIAIVLIAACYGPFWAGIQTFTGLGQQIRPQYYNSSVVGFVAAPLEQLVSANKQAALDKTIRLLCYAMFAGYTFIQIRRLWLRGPNATLRDVITGSAKVTFAALLLITFWFQPWYVIWLLPLAALADEPFVRRQGMFFALGALMTYAVSNFLFVQDNDFARGLFVQFFEIIVVFGPLLLLRGMPDEQGWSAIIRRNLREATQWLSGRPVFWDRVMLALVMLVAALLRLVRLDSNLFTTIPRNSTTTNILKQLGGDLRLLLSDPQGLSGPFAAVQGVFIAIFGDTPFAALLPSALIGSFTVLAIYLLTLEILRQGSMPGKHTIALLAALLVATSAWHVSLSRSGMEVVSLPLLMCLALYWLLRALRVETSVPTVPTKEHNGFQRGKAAAPRSTTGADARGLARLSTLAHRRILGMRGDQFAQILGVGICTGLACDLAPGLWLVPLTIVAFLLLWAWRRPSGLTVTRRAVVLLSVTSVIAGAPALWHFASRFVGFPPGSALLAQTSVVTRPGPGVFSLGFWGQVLTNAGATLNLLTSQDFSAGYPSTGGTAIIPALLLPFAVVGLYTIIRWRGFVSLAMLALIALPLVASVAVGTSTSVIDAASVLPALCIVPAIGIFTCGEWVGRGLIVLDRTNGVRVFSTPERIGRIVLLIFLLASTVRTFFWYFEAALPAPNQQWTPSFAPAQVARAAPSAKSPRVLVVSFPPRGDTTIRRTS